MVKPKVLGWEVVETAYSRLGINLNSMFYFGKWFELNILQIGKQFKLNTSLSEGVKTKVLGWEVVVTEYSRLGSGLNSILYFRKWLKLNVLGWEVVVTEYSWSGSSLNSILYFPKGLKLNVLGWEVVVTEYSR